MLLLFWKLFQRLSTCAFLMLSCPKQQRRTVMMPENMFQAPVHTFEPNWEDEDIIIVNFQNHKGPSIKNCYLMRAIRLRALKYKSLNSNILCWTPIPSCEVNAIRIHQLNCPPKIKRGYIQLKLQNKEICCHLTVVANLQPQLSGWGEDKVKLYFPWIKGHDPSGGNFLQHWQHPQSCDVGSSHLEVYLEYWEGHHEIDSRCELDSSGDTEQRKVHYDAIDDNDDANLDDDWDDCNLPQQWWWEWWWWEWWWEWWWW